MHWRCEGKFFKWFFPIERSRRRWSWKSYNFIHSWDDLVFSKRTDQALSRFKPESEAACSLHCLGLSDIWTVSIVSQQSGTKAHIYQKRLQRYIWKEIKSKDPSEEAWAVLHWTHFSRRIWKAERRVNSKAGTRAPGYQRVQTGAQNEGSQEGHVELADSWGCLRDWLRCQQWVRHHH